LTHRYGSSVIGGITYDDATGQMTGYTENVVRAGQTKTHTIRTNLSYNELSQIKSYKDTITNLEGATDLVTTIYFGNWNASGNVLPTYDTYGRLLSYVERKFEKDISTSGATLNVITTITRSGIDYDATGQMKNYREIVEKGGQVTITTDRSVIVYNELGQIKTYTDKIQSKDRSTGVKVSSDLTVSFSATATDAYDEYGRLYHYNEEKTQDSQTSDTATAGYIVTIERTSTTYNNKGRISEYNESSKLGNAVTYSLVKIADTDYDELGQIKKQTEYSKLNAAVTVSNFDTKNIKSEMRYNAFGRLTTFKDTRTQYSQKSSGPVAYDSITTRELVVYNDNTGRMNKYRDKTEVVGTNSYTSTLTIIGDDDYYATGQVKWQEEYTSLNSTATIFVFNIKTIRGGLIAGSGILYNSLGLISTYKDIRTEKIDPAAMVSAVGSSTYDIHTSRTKTEYDTVTSRVKAHNETTAIYDTNGDLISTTYRRATIDAYHATGQASATTEYLHNDKPANEQSYETGWVSRTVRTGIYYNEFGTLKTFTDKATQKTHTKDGNKPYDRVTIRLDTTYDNRNRVLSYKDRIDFYEGEKSASNPTPKSTTYRWVSDIVYYGDTDLVKQQTEYNNDESVPTLTVWQTKSVRSDMKYDSARRVRTFKDVTTQKSYSTGGAIIDYNTTVERLSTEYDDVHNRISGYSDKVMLHFGTLPIVVSTNYRLITGMGYDDETDQVLQQTEYSDDIPITKALLDADYNYNSKTTRTNIIYDYSARVSTFTDVSLQKTLNAQTSVAEDFQTTIQRMVTEYGAKNRVTQYKDKIETYKGIKDNKNEDPIATSYRLVLIDNDTGFHTTGQAKEQTEYVDYADITKPVGALDYNFNTKTVKSGITYNGSGLMDAFKDTLTQRSAIDLLGDGSETLSDYATVTDREYTLYDESSRVLAYKDSVKTYKSATVINNANLVYTSYRIATGMLYGETGQLQQQTEYTSDSSDISTTNWQVENIKSSISYDDSGRVYGYKDTTTQYTQTSSGASEKYKTVTERKDTKYFDDNTANGSRVKEYYDEIKLYKGITNIIVSTNSRLVRIGQYYTTGQTKRQTEYSKDTAGVTDSDWTTRTHRTGFTGVVETGIVYDSIGRILTFTDEASQSINDTTSKYKAVTTRLSTTYGNDKTSDALRIKSYEDQTKIYSGTSNITVSTSSRLVNNINYYSTGQILSQVEFTKEITGVTATDWQVKNTRTNVIYDNSGRIVKFNDDLRQKLPDDSSYKTTTERKSTTYYDDNTVDGSRAKSYEDEIILYQSTSTTAVSTSSRLVDEIAYYAGGQILSQVEYS
ncbi:MAG: hypothetical protein COW10_07415, partial [Candidatus Omnitrophica bacterium CG12_big_fil_rev_8_21_14_0_65_42_8]